MHGEQMRVEGLNGISVVTLRGDLDAGSARELEDLLDGLLDNGKRAVIVDMTGANFVGNSVISVLLGFTGCMRKIGGELKMCGLPDLVDYIFEVLGVEEYLNVFKDRTGALLSCPEKFRHHLNIQDRRNGIDRRKADLPFQGKDRRKSKRRYTPLQGPRLSLPVLVFT